ncbi:MAG TPA: hypothetical protein VND19_14155 [Acetobacteraceae bacterium]|nr:hypothetical protein [Acetobacteraceae bacterium]
MSIDREQRAAAWLQAWDLSGTHRTGTAGDAAGAAWLAREAAALGAAVMVEEFALDRIDPGAAYLDVDGVRFDGVPVFDAPATGPDGIAGTLGTVGSDATIGVAELAPLAVYSGAYRAIRSGTAHAGLVIVCQGGQSGLALLNAERFRDPYGAPAIHVGSEARDAILSAGARGATARLVAHSTRSPARADNVVVTLPGRDPARPRLVVMTPRSSWWHSTAERGGGLVCWLESLRALRTAPPACDVVFTANSGHELGHVGLDDFVARRPGWDRPGGAVWVHYGANLGATGGRLSLMSNDDALRAFAADALARAGQKPDVLAPVSQVPSGETRDIHRAGGRYVTLVGSNALFHLPQDRWPHAVGLAAVARIAAGAAGLVMTLAH